MTRVLVNQREAVAMPSQSTPAARRYVKRFMPAMAAYVVLLLVICNWFEARPPAGLLRYAAALLPTAPLLFCIWALGAYMREEADEFQRAMCVRSVLWGLGGVLATTTVLGFLETFAGTPRLPLYLVFPMFACFMGAAGLFVRRAYR